ncbi:MAG: hypothetical protein ABSH28_13885 [Acidobacteriota bacterium]|jgi:hypothetical protein
MAKGRKGGKNNVFPKGKRKLITLWLYEDDYRLVTELAQKDTIPRGTLVRKLLLEGLHRLQAAKK